MKKEAFEDVCIDDARALATRHEALWRLVGAAQSLLKSGDGDERDGDGVRLAIDNFGEAERALSERRTMARGWRSAWEFIDDVCGTPPKGGE